MRSLPALLAIVSAVVTLGAQAPAKTEADLATLGPRIGQRVPDFRLPDQTGTVRDLKSVLKRGGAMLVFFRSAEW
jgi:cytochrome oxidase Cu insertion factor (SCO1/SenC/PrrC family)